MNQLHIDKREKQAALYLTNATVLRGAVFLSEFSQRHSGPQTILDLMMEQTAMFPLRDRTNRFVLVGKAGVVAAEITDRDHEEIGFWTRVPVRLEMTGGHRFQGTFLIDGSSGGRISDVVNSGAEWLRIETPTSDVWLSRPHILTARPDD